MVRRIRSSSSRNLSVDLTVTIYEDDTPGFHDYGLSRPVWIRACSIMSRHGFERALSIMDAKAERAFDRGDLATCVRWRALMAAVHAIGSDDPLPCDRVH